MADDAEEFDDRIEQRESKDGVLVRFHVDAIQVRKFDARFLLAAEELDDGHAADVFL